jgi:hypothetical protein
MHGAYDRSLMERGKVARALISEGEDPYRMLAAVVWPGRDWTEDALRARLRSCPRCSDEIVGCDECGGTGLVTIARHRLLVADTSAAA